MEAWRTAAGRRVFTGRRSSSGLNCRHGAALWLYKSASCLKITGLTAIRRISMSAHAQDSYRLPTDVKPTHYDLTIRTDLETLTFDGIVKIHLDVLKTTSRIALHTNLLELEDVSLASDASQAEQAPSSSAFDAANERSAFVFADALPAGSKAQLKIAFGGKLTSDLVGYYRSASSTVGEGSPTTDARRAFPCWDEPLLKATFAINMVSRAGTVNLSNMPAASETRLSSAADKWKITRFETTPRCMSTYLAAYANGHFDYLESSYTSPLSGKTRPLRIYATSDKIHQAQFALDVERMFPLPKLDTLVVRAMENWGLITGRTTAFLLDQEKASLPAKKNVARTSSHEVSHMWSVGEMIVISKPMETGPSICDREARLALTLDAKLSSHPIEVDCPDSSAIGQIFDLLSYQKAASILRMLLNYVGEERFLKGVSIYLKKHLYANSVTRDLWEGIGAATGIDVPKMMDNWVKKIGFPVVTVTETKDGIHVRQDRFLETGPAKPEQNETIWTIPLSLLTVSKTGDVVLDKEIVLDEREKTIALDTSQPFKLNTGTVGTYRVLYTPERLAKIATEAAKTPSPFSVEDRMGLTNDTLELSRAGFTDVSNALSLIEVLCRDEKDYLVWLSISTNLANIIGNWWEYANITDPLDALRRELFGPIVARLGYEYPEDEPVETRQLRTLAISEAASGGEGSVVQELTARFAHYVQTGDDSGIPADLEAATYATAVKHGGRAEWEAVKKIFAKPKNPSTNISAIVALGQTQDMALAEETVALMLDGAREQDLFFFFQGLSRNFKTRRYAADAFKAHYDTFYSKLSGGGTGLRIAIEAVFGALSSKKDHHATAAFFGAKDVSKYDMTLKQALESILTRSAWIERSTTDISKWLEDRAIKSKDL
ncbi:peptidase family M1-domain-containing protein [Amylocystis lapponica]|nr:peptidase family M1-domain-containing protein [Amylocystis lapponica]